MWRCNGYYIGFLLQRSCARILIVAFCKTEKRGGGNLKTGSIRFNGFHEFDRFSDKVNFNIEPDRCHGRFAVQPGDMAGLRFNRSNWPVRSDFQNTAYFWYEWRRWYSTRMRGAEKYIFFLKKMIFLIFFCFVFCFFPTKPSK